MNIVEVAIKKAVDMTTKENVATVSAADGPASAAEFAAVAEIAGLSAAEPSEVVAAATADVMSTRDEESSGQPKLQRKLTIRSALGNMIARPMETRPWYIVDPRGSFSSNWDTVTSIALIFTALFTPFEVGFVQPARFPWQPWFIVNRIVDVIFISDFILQFFLAYLAPPTRDGKAAMWIFHQGKIAKNYVTSAWFPLDVLSILVAALDYFELQVVQQALDLQSGAIAKMKALRVLRALRLIKLIRLLRGSRILKRWEVRHALNYGMLELWKNVGMVFLMCHLFACVWALQTGFHDSKLDSWMASNDYCYLCGGVGEVDCPPEDSGLIQPHPNLTYACLDNNVLYAASLYWSAMTITSIGYGDISASAGNALELYICALLMLMAGFAWGNVVAGFVNVVSNLNPERTEFRQTMDELNGFMYEERLPIELQRRLREYFHQTLHLRKTAKQSALMETMSPSLQAEVSWRVNRKWLDRIWFLRGAPFPFLLRLSKRIRPLVLAPSEPAPPGQLYIINRGLALYGGRVLGAGKVWGEDTCILTSHALHSIFVARAMTFLECYCIDRTDIEAVVVAFPEFAEVLRHRACRLATRRAFIIEARRRLEETEAKMKESGRRASAAGLKRQSTLLSRSGDWFAGTGHAVTSGAACAPTQAPSAGDGKKMSVLQRVCSRRRARTSAPADSDGPKLSDEPDFGGNLLGTSPTTPVPQKFNSGFRKSRPSSLLSSAREDSESGKEGNGGGGGGGAAAAEEVAALKDALEKLTLQVAEGFATIGNRQEALRLEMLKASAMPPLLPGAMPPAAAPASLRPKGPPGPRKGSLDTMTRESWPRYAVPAEDPIEEGGGGGGGEDTPSSKAEDEPGHSAWV